MFVECDRFISLPFMFVTLIFGCAYQSCSHYLERRTSFLLSVCVHHPIANQSISLTHFIAQHKTARSHYYFFCEYVHSDNVSVKTKAIRIYTALSVYFTADSFMREAIMEIQLAKINCKNFPLLFYI